MIYSVSNVMSIGAGGTGTWAGEGLLAVARSRQAQRGEKTYRNPTNTQGNKKALKGVENQRRTSAIRRFL